MTASALCLVALLMATGCAVERLDPHTEGDQCLYTCSDERICAGTAFSRGCPLTSRTAGSTRSIPCRGAVHRVDALYPAGYTRSQ